MRAVLVPVWLLLVIPIFITSWASTTSSELVLNPIQMCKRPDRLRPKMANICHNRPELIKHITDGLNLAQSECQYQFRYRRWNCTSVNKSIKKVMLRDTRETGFVNAIIAAGVTYQVTKACAKGDLLGCSCDKKKNHIRKNKRKKVLRKPDNDWQWEGCGENIEFGIKRSKDFLDTRFKKRSDIKNLVKLHNYGAGRLAIKSHMRKECKCHGLSGSCSLKTCTRKMPTFREIGSRLRARFDGAAKVIPNNDGQSFIPEGDTIKPPTRSDLVYSEETPDFCVPNNTVGSFGTQGRVCNETSQGEEGCGILCCGRGALTTNQEIVTNCHCKFHYCCKVECQRCNETVRISTCL